MYSVVKNSMVFLIYIYKYVVFNNKRYHQKLKNAFDEHHRFIQIYYTQLLLNNMCVILESERSEERIDDVCLFCYFAVCKQLFDWKYCSTQKF